MKQTTTSPAFSDAEMPALRGLSHEEAARRLRAEGYNELPSSRPRSLLAIAAGVLREPMILLLVAAGALYLVLGDLAEAVLLAGSIFVVVGISLYQEHRTERALEALRDLSSPRALVVRDGEQVRIAGRDVVRGDVIILTEGDRVPADGVLLSGTNVSVDESLLTGESVPVRKVEGRASTTMAPPGGDDQPYVYSGTLVVRGRGVAEVLATGAATALGRIGKALETVEVEQTRVQRETRGVVQLLAIVAISLCLLVSAIYGLAHGWEDGLLTGITLAMAIIPEEFPVVLTVFLGLGAWRLSRQQVLTRQVPAVETLGSATVLCVDKTGTLTLNQMAVRGLFAGGRYLTFDDTPEALDGAFHELVEFAALASQRDPFDPMDRAIRDLAHRALPDDGMLHHDWDLAREYPLSPELLALSQAWRSTDTDGYVIAAKGAPEAIVRLCRMEAGEAAALEGRVQAMAADGLRILGVAKAVAGDSELPEAQHEFEFTFVGLVGLLDPVRPSVPGAVHECYTAGMRVIMITGDYEGTARHIASEAGIRPADEVINGFELADISDDALRERVRTVNIFARMVPEQKLRLVEALKANGEIVAMTGDGVNDAPALKSAHIGIAMGGRGTDVAREAAALVLLDDDFSSIVRSVRMGRGIFDNLRKAMSYLVAVHLPIAALAVLPVLLQTPLVLLPAHVVFLELIIDPACSIAFEAEPPPGDVMTRPPRRVDERLFSRGLLRLSLVQGAGVLLVVLAVYAFTWLSDHDEEEARAMTFLTLTLANVALILVNRAWSRSLLSTLRVRNIAFWLVAMGSLSTLALVLSVPPLRDLFSFAPLEAYQVAISVAACALGILLFEVFKVVRGDRLAA